MNHRNHEPSARTVIPPCPHWCTRAPGHEYDSVTSWQESVFERLHIAYSGPGAVEVAAVEQNADGALWLADPEVYVVNDAQSYTADQTRALAAELLEAVAVIEEITR